MIKSKLKTLIFAATMLLGAGSAQAVPTNLYLAMDGSGSIDAGEFTAQITSYTGGLQAFFDANPAAFGQVAIGGNIFGQNVAQFFALTVIANQTVLDTLIAAITGLDPGRAGINTGEYRHRRCYHGRHRVAERLRELRS